MTLISKNSATRLLLKLCPGWGPADGEEEELDDDDQLSNFFDEVLSTDFDDIPEEDEEVEEADKDAADPDASEAVGGEEGDEVQPVVKPAVKEKQEEAVVEPVAKQPEDQVVEPAPVVAPVKTEAEQQKEYADTISELEKVYAISEEDADAILTDPKTVLPRMQARAHVMMVQTMHNMITALVPQLIEQVGTQQAVKKTLMEQFSTAWPDLVSKDVEPTVIEAVVSVRKRFPNIGNEELIKKVGPVAYALLGKEQPVKAATPSAPAPKAKPRPFTPAKQSATPPKTPSNDPMTNFFDAILNGND